MNNFFWESQPKSDEEKRQYLDKMVNDQLTNWARIHEAHLENNHLNGHYVGNRVYSVFKNFDFSRVYILYSY